MERRRALLMMPRGLDTSPVIAVYNAKISGRNNVAGDGMCITIKYYYAPQNATLTIAYYGTDAQQCRVYKNNGETYMDYWTLQHNDSPRKVINKGSDAIEFTLSMKMLNDAYAFIVETGQIFFAGKNTPYYGHQNISELN